MPSLILQDFLEMPWVMRTTRRLRPLFQVARATGAWLGTMRHPNAALASLVLIPVFVFGFSFGSRMHVEREALAGELSDLSLVLGFGVEQVTIEGLRDTREGDVLDYLAIGPDTSLIGFDIESARQRVLALPWVKEASVRRAYPDTLFVEIAEHDAFARLLDHGRVQLVTLDGVEITHEVAAHHEGLPLVMGEGAPQHATDFFAHLIARPHLLQSVVALERVGARRWTLHMTHGVLVHLPEGEIASGLERLEALMHRHAILERAIASIDLRRADHLTVRLTDGGIRAIEGNDGDALAATRARQGGA